MAKHSSHRPKPKHRNNGGGGPALPRPRRRALQRGQTPDFSMTLASVAGGGGGAVLGGFLANQEILSPETVGLAMTVGGAIGAYTLDGAARVAANGIAAAGAGQLALALMQKRVTEKAPDKKPDEPAAPRQGYRPRVLANFQSIAPEVATRLGFVDDDFDDGFDE